MPDYQQGKIYKITCGDETYYGSTAMTLRERMWLHKSNYKRWKNGTDSKCACFNLFDKYGFDNCPIELVEDYSCETKKELLIREDWYMDNNDCINEKSAYTSKEEQLEQMRQRHQDHKEEENEKSRQWYQDHKEEASEKSRQRHQDHKEELNEKSRQWYQDHKEECNEKGRQWHQDHKEEANEKSRQWYQANKEEISEKKKERFMCECGRLVQKTQTARHRKTERHLANI